jgi:hypothetical protein
VPYPRDRYGNGPSELCYQYDDDNGARRDRDGGCWMQEPAELGGVGATVALRQAEAESDKRVRWGNGNL